MNTCILEAGKFSCLQGFYVDPPRGLTCVDAAWATADRGANGLLPGFNSDLLATDAACMPRPKPDGSNGCARPDRFEPMAGGTGDEAAEEPEPDAEPEPEFECARPVCPLAWGRPLALEEAEAGAWRWMMPGPALSSRWLGRESRELCAGRWIGGRVCD